MTLRIFASLALVLLSPLSYACTLEPEKYPPIELGVVKTWRNVVANNGNKTSTFAWEKATLLDNLVFRNHLYAIFDLTRPSSNGKVTYTRNVLVVCDEKSDSWKPVALPSTVDVPPGEAYITPPKFEYLSQVRLPDGDDIKLIVGGHFEGISDVRRNPDWKLISPEESNEHDLHFFFSMGRDELMLVVDGLERSPMSNVLTPSSSGIELFNLGEKTYLSIAVQPRHRGDKTLEIYELQRQSMTWKKVSVPGPTGDILEGIPFEGRLLITTNGDSASSRVRFNGAFVVKHEGQKDTLERQTWFFEGDRWVLAH